MRTRIESFETDEALVQGILPALLKREAHNTLLIGMLLAVQRGQMARPAYAVRVGSSASPVGAALLVPPFGLFITALDEDAAALLAVDALAQGHPIAGVVGPEKSARAVAAALSARDGRGAPRVQMAQHIHVIEALSAPLDVSGALRPVTENEATLAYDWCRAFAVDCGLEHVDAEAERLSSKWRHGDLFMWWTDGGPVCLVGVAGHSPHGARVGPVYTPPSARQRGYGTAATAALTARLLDAGATFCCLFTDVKNPTSNKIYAAIGYRVVGESVHLAWPSPSDA